MSTRQECIVNLQSVSDKKLHKELAKFGNAKLGHIWDYTEMDMLKAICCLTSYVVQNGKKSGIKELDDNYYKKLEWREGESMVRMEVWAQ